MVMRCETRLPKRLYLDLAALEEPEAFFARCYRILTEQPRPVRYFASAPEPNAGAW
jgi:hypothetical protein